jgi:hypothetical protein
VIFVNKVLYEEFQQVNFRHVASDNTCMHGLVVANGDRWWSRPTANNVSEDMQKPTSVVVALALGSGK